MFELPTSISIGDKNYPIRCKGDYRMVLDCFAALEDAELEESERVYSSLIIFYEDLADIDDLYIFGDNLQEAVDKMFFFFNCNQESIGAKSNYKLVDWEKDEQLIASAVNNVARMEIRSVDYMHWWTFMGYYLSIGKSSFSTVVSIRDKIKRGKKLEKYEQQFKRDNPDYFIWNSKTVNQRQDENDILALWNKED